MQLLYRLVTALIIVSILSAPSCVNGALADQDQHDWLHTLLIAANTQVDLTESDATTRSFLLSDRSAISALVDAVRGIVAGYLTLLRPNCEVATYRSKSLWQIVLMPNQSEVSQLVNQNATSGRDTRVAQLRIVQPNDDTQTMYVGIPS